MAASGMLRAILAPATMGPSRSRDQPSTPRLVKDDDQLEDRLQVIRPQYNPIHLHRALIKRLLRRRPTSLAKDNQASDKLMSSFGGNTRRSGRSPACGLRGCKSGSQTSGRAHKETLGIQDSPKV